MKVDMWNRASLTVVLLWSLVYSVSSESADSKRTTPEEQDVLTTTPTPGKLDVTTNRRWATGLWGSWSSWSECSRTCGRGVATQTRTCQQESEYLRIRRMRHSRIHGNNDFADAKRCLGVYRRFQLCNSKPCEGLVDMRWEQCAAFDRQPFYGSLYKWEPFVKDPSRCELQCRPVGQRFYATLAKVVEDGTPCSAPSQSSLDAQEDSICVAGQCKVVGCDGVIGSLTRWDVCRVCGGDNSTCRPVSGLFTRPVLPVGYNLLATIPRGARNIRIFELAKSRNFLALLMEDGASALNGNWSISRSGVFAAVGTKFTYRRHSEGGLGQSISSPGPTNQALQLMLIYQQRSPGVQYTYTLPVYLPGETLEAKASSSYAKGSKQRGRNSTKLPKNPKHRWKYRNKYDRRKPTLGPATFDGSNWVGGAQQGPMVYDGSKWVAGAQQRGNSTRTYRKTPRNIDFRRRSSVDRTSPSGATPSFSQKDVLNDVDVGAVNREIHWKLLGYSDCTKSCGGGTRLAAPVCYSESHKAIVADQHCTNQVKPEPGQTSCNKDPCPGTWTTGEWSECSTSCGEGKQVRKVNCEGEAQACAAQEAPPTARSCKLKPCFRWDTSEWGQCSSSCGSGVRRRRVRCVRDSEPTEPGRCETPRPPDEEPCRSSVLCSTSSNQMTDGKPAALTTPTASTTSVEWLTTDWDRQECGERHPQNLCSERMERRDLICVQGSQHMAESFCPTSSRPSTVQPCVPTQRPEKGCEGEWFSGQWSDCPRDTCDGVQRRSLACLSSGPSKSILSDDHCGGRSRPDEERKCRRDCSSWTSPKSPLDVTKTRQWFTGEWSPCSTSCGPGVQTRTVLCPDQPAEGDCDNQRPDARRTCVEDRPGCPTSIANSSCVDKNTNCHLVVQSRLCHYGYYSDICCRSCALSLT